MWSNYLSPYIYIICFLLFAVPLIFLCIKKEIFNPFTFNKLTIIFNWSLLYYASISAVLIIIATINPIKINDFIEVVIGAVYCYVVVGAFFYVPPIVLINLVNLIIKLIIKYRSKS